MTFDAIDTWWWPLVFILIAGWIATDMWRWLGVLMGNRIDDSSEILVYIRSVATALVAAVIAQLIVFPSGALAETPVLLRIAAALSGFAAYIFIGRHVGLGVLAALVVLSAGMALGI
ncbi:AzlD domain-containing protein [Ahrensia kielensis]|uniref:AzlD domain-containing protein n=1 Tax=Ahrensia kielensis TaxID=76980 RepID=A0ABU9T3H5_9HYPH|nr:AzlD domain-containing protein [Ahrensia sp. 13_GOM-1096m]